MNVRWGLVMPEGEERKQIIDQIAKAEDQPQDLRDLFKALNVARRQFSLYGAEHPNTDAALSALIPVLDCYVKTHGPSTFILTKQAIIVNDQCYSPSDESLELCGRLRSRGCMALTLLQDIPAQQLHEFFMFLNVEPQTIIAEGGPSTYLRRRGVSRLVVTEAVYTTGDGTGSDIQTDGGTELDSSELDRALVAAIDWLSKREDDKDDSLPQLPIGSILSDPSKGAKLIREAVTKLHSSQRSGSTAELSIEAINNMKGMASTDPDKWDQATPQIRKAILKLPKEMRPTSIEFGTEANETSSSTDGHVVDVMEVETLLARDLEQSPTGKSLRSVLGLDYFELFLKAKTTGLMSSWQQELEPRAFIQSSGDTFAILMNWENNASEHGRIARALAQLVARAIDMNESEFALDLAEKLVKEAECDDSRRWRTTNVQAALQTLDIAILKPIVQKGLMSEAHRKIAASLVKMLPSLALSLADLLCSGLSETVRRSLEEGIARSGRSAVPILGKLLVEGTPEGQESALRILIGMKDEAAIREIEKCLDSVDSKFHAHILEMLTGIRSPSVTRICVNSLSSKDSEVRCAAMYTLGKVGEPWVVSHLIPFVVPRFFQRVSMTERLTAIRSLGQIAHPDALQALERIASHRPLLGRQGYEPIRMSAQQAIADIRSRLTETLPLAA